MLSREMLYAILQGLPYKYFQHLDAPWPLIAKRINLCLDEGLDPVSALKAAFKWMGPYERRTVKETLLLVAPVMHIPGLSYRQREVLVALRSAKIASLSQLCRTLAQDRGNTHRRLAALVSKGLAVRFFQPGGAFYFAIPAPMEKSVKLAVNQFIDDLTDEFAAEPTTPTTSTTPTILVFPRISGHEKCRGS
ncbi:MAG: helix-turn-helix domain-containing protein, partial [Anaerolineales bacterium]